MSGASWGAYRPAAERDDLAPTLSGLHIQLRVIHALMLREMQTRFGRKQLGFVWLFLEPLMLAGAIATIKGTLEVGHSIPGVSIFVFALVSYLPYFTFRAIVSRAPGTLRANMTLLYHAQIKLLDVVLARHALEMGAVMSIMAVIVFGVWMWGGTPPHSIVAVIGGLTLLFLLAHGLGLLAAAAAAVSEVAEKLIHPLVYLSLPLSGALFPLQNLDPVTRGVLLWNPQANIHEIVREGFFGDHLTSHFDVGYVLFCVAAVNLLGLAALRAVRPRLEF